jgi:FtsP/CotA-like multicopper oxidase with cupredoxin domain
MYNTPWSDGVPGLSQRPIQPGKSFKYKWTATNYGSYWYHAHEKGQIEDGLYGAIIIRPKEEQPKPFKLISKEESTIEAMERAEERVTSLLLNDFRHTTFPETWDITLKAGFELPCYDSILINGKGSAICRSPSEIASLVRPDQQQLLGMVNMTMTDKA